MNIRFKFTPGAQTKFLDNVRTVSGLTTKQLAKMANISPRNFRKWMREEAAITQSAALEFQRKFQTGLPESESKLLSRWNLSKWNARASGGKKSLEIMRMKGIIPEPKNFKLPESLNPDLAEYVGILLGDGGITHGQIKITLNKTADKLYIPFVIKLGEKLFGEKPKRFNQKGANATVLYHTGVNLVKYLERIGLNKGNKVELQVDVPLWVKNSQNFSVACLRGLVDTDGGIHNHQYHVGGKKYEYRKLCFSNRSIPLISFAHETLSGMGFHPKVVLNMATKRVWLYNTNEVKKYLKVIGSNNPRLYTW